MTDAETRRANRKPFDDASQAINYLLRALAIMENENSKLRHDLEEANNQAEEVCIENAKLRKLMRIMAYCMQDSKDCDKCALNGADTELEVDPLFACDDLYDKLRELGVEDGK